MTRVTAFEILSLQHRIVRSSPLITIVGRDPGARLAAAAAFDDAPLDWSVSADESQASSADVVVATPETDWPGAVKFDPQQPRQLVPAIRARLQGRVGIGRRFVVANSRAGAGSTTLALELAVRWGAVSPTCLVDLDPACGVALRLGVGGGTGSGSAPGDPPLTVPIADGVRLLSFGEAPPEAQSALLDRLASDFDTLVIDGGASLPQPSARAARAIVIVFAPTPSHVASTRACLKSLVDRPVALVANHTGWGGEIARFELERMLGRRLTVDLPFTAVLRDIERDGGCRAPRWSRWSRAVDRLWAALDNL